MKPLALVLALALAAALSATPASAFFRITTVACDTVGTSPLMVRTTFNLDLVGPGGYNWFEMTPLPAGPSAADSTHFYSALAPANWVVYPQCPGCQWFEFQPQTGGMTTGDHIAGFQVITNRAGPCAHFVFDNFLLDLDHRAAGDGCMILDGPVPANTASWGQVKSIYRR